MTRLFEVTFEKAEWGTNYDRRTFRARTALEAVHKAATFYKKLESGVRPVEVKLIGESDD